MKTIAILHPSNELYGADRILVNALVAFPEEDLKVVYLASEGPLTAFIKEHVSNVQVQIIPFLPIIYRAIFSPRGIISFQKNRRKFKRFFNHEHRTFGFDLAYVNTLSCSFMLPYLKKMNIPSVCHVHEIIERPKFIAKVTTHLVSRYCERVICVSEAVQNNLIRYSRNVKHKCIIVHNGIIPIDVKEKKPTDVLTFYLFGRIMPQKGHWYLLDALHTVPRKLLVNSQFVLVGGTLEGKESLLDDLKKRIEEYHLGDFVSVTGFTSDIASEMEKADVCLVPSLMKDPFPTTVLEAMSAGKPVIATNHGGAKEAIEHGMNGYLVNPNKPLELAKAIQQFIEHKETTKAFGIEAKRQFIERFTLDQFKINWLKAIEFQHHY